MPPSPLIDLSDLDPLAPAASSSASTSRTASPHPHGALFPPPLRRPSSSAARSPSPVPAVPRPTQGVRAEDVGAGEDPLAGLLGGLQVSSSPAAAATDAVDRVRRAQDAREERVLRDLRREPFRAAETFDRGAASSSSASAAFVDEPASLEPTPSSSTAVPIPPSPRRRAPTSHTSFSPPRRLSSLMDLSSSASFHAPSSPPAETSVFADPFRSHARARTRTTSSGGGGRRENGHGRGGEDGGDDAEWEKGIEQAMEANISAEWGDFQDAPAAAADDPPPPPAASTNGPGAGGGGFFGSSSSLRSSSFPSASASAAAASASATLSTAASALTSSLASNTHSTLSSLFANANAPAPPEAYERKPLPQRAATTVATGRGGFDPAAQPITLVGVRPGVVRVLEEDIAEGIRSALPPRLRLSPRWTLLYSLDQHGISLQTLFANLSRGLKDRDGGFVLVVKSDRGEVFGGYCSEPLRDSSASRDTRAQRWSGDGSCFLWKSVPFPPSDFRLGSSVRVFKPTFRNTYFQHASSQFLAFGGGEDGVFGLWIDGVFERGWTGTCETYRNEPLVDVKARGGGGGPETEKDADGARGQETGKFEVVGLECWAVGS